MLFNNEYGHNLYITYYLSYTSVTVM